MPTIPASMLERMEAYPGEIEVCGPFIGCVGGIDGHTDELFSPWSAFYTVRNDGCRVWQRGGYRGVPKAGERFQVCIHKLHGVITPRRQGSQAIVLLHADGRTQQAAIRNLGKVLRKMRSACPAGSTCPNERSL